MISWPSKHDSTDLHGYLAAAQERIAELERQVAYWMMVDVKNQQCLSSLEAALRDVERFAEAHHDDQPAYVLLHALQIDIPEIARQALASGHDKEPS